MPIALLVVKSLAAFMGGCGLLFPGDFVTSANFAALLLYTSWPAGDTTCIVLKERLNTTAVLNTTFA